MAEGIRSSFTCPLVANGVPVGFLFFSSIYPDTYENIHISVFKQITESLSTIIAHARLTEKLPIRTRS